MRVLPSRATLLVLSCLIGMILAGAPGGLTPAAAATPPATIHVPADQPTIQAGIDAAAAGDIVLAAPGTHTGAGNRDIDFGGKDVELRSEGGAAVTIIDCQASAIDNARGIVLQSGESAAAVVNGFTIRNGYRSGTDFPDGYGVGMLISGAGTAPTVEACVIENNVAEGGGGAMLCDVGSAPAISMCTFNGNSSSIAGGALMNGIGASVDDLRGCTFQGNSAFAGGAAECALGASLGFTSCVFAANQIIGTSSIGGVLHCEAATITLASCTFYENTGTGGSGLGILNAATSRPIRCSATSGSATSGRPAARRARRGTRAAAG